MKATHSSVLAACLVAISFLIGLVGCGGPSADGSGGHKTHGGTPLALPNKAGVVELLVEPADPRARKGTRGKSKVVAYFFNADQSGPPDPVPTDVAFTDEAGKKHTLTATTDDANSARFESESLTLTVGEPTGTLEARMGGKSVRVLNRPR